MSLKLMYITNNPKIAKIAESCGVDRIFVDMEYIGKDKRQGGMDTVQCHHTFEDIQKISKTVKTSKVLVRVNPIHKQTDQYISSEEEIEKAIESGAQILMLPYFKTIDEVQIFLNLVHGRVKTMLLVETPEAVSIIDDILKLEGIDELFIGLNDLSLGYKKKFMFQLLSDGTVEALCSKFKEKNIPYGFGGITRIGQGMLPAEYIIAEHLRLGSTSVILSRSFCDSKKIHDNDQIESIFFKGIKDIKEYERNIENESEDFFANNIIKVKNSVQKIVECQ